MDARKDKQKIYLLTQCTVSLGSGATPGGNNLQRVCQLSPRHNDAGEGRRDGLIILRENGEAATKIDVTFALLR